MGKKRSHDPGKLIPVTLKKLPDGWHADGGNLYLFIRGNSRAWVFRYSGADGKRKHMGLGSLGNLSLANARQKAQEIRTKLKDPISPIDPLQSRREIKELTRLEVAKRLTFKQCAEAFLEAHGAKWSNPKHRAQWGSTLETYAYPEIGELSVAAIDTGLVLRVVEPLWTTKTETASRLRGRVESVLDWAKVRGYRQGENPARWRGHLDKLLPERSKVAKVEHHAALPFSEIQGFMKTLRTKEGIAAKALDFSILTAARSGEVRQADWSEIDLTEKTWSVPAERMKAKRDHRVPLSDAAVRILEALPHREGLIFIGAKKDRPMSDGTLTAVLKRMKRDDVTVHGFRSSFRDWVSEKTNYDSATAEAALAHVIGDRIEAAYRRGDLFEKRRSMMQDWARFCENGEEPRVIHLASKK